ncbi:iron complex outermembrane recepter protein [Dyella jiangningensis]|uniref:TonB-dependent receptor domain-containing protein n=1 Tax=Dyella sp. AtDHG13 TaxID=1938897 RepID=UPI00088146B5|nr:TonB-dependent receptor [Dyella sp. AtDHG13]PXV56103.1 iron complex outermembrane receptor protein [Dyella sp. AtDHG13]SDK71886.1 iron complex outermembrane recepter protein [Dyella jiangningensis]
MKQHKRGRSGNGCRPCGMPAINALAMAMRVAGVAGAMAFAGSALAQASSQTSPSSTPPVTQDAGQPASPAPSEKNAKQMQAVNVTGTNIRGVDLETALPTITITRDDIQRQGFATVGQLLQNIPAAATPDLSRADAGSLGVNQGGTFIDLRGLGAQRTLVLVDGQRIGAVHGGYTDISVIPAAIVDHIDILGSGASAIYGSDAIAGVINIVTLKNFNGVQIDSYLGQYMPHNDGAQAQFSVTAGHSGERNSIIVSASDQYQGSVWGSDRPWSAYPQTNHYPYFGLSSLPPDSGLILNAPNADPATGSHVLTLNPGGNPSNIADWSYRTPRVYAPNGNITSLANAGSWKYNYSGLSTTLSPNRTKNLYLSDHFKLTDHITAHVDLGYNQSWNGGAGGPSYLYTGQSSNPPDLPQFPLLLSSQSYYNPYNAPGQTPQDVSFERLFPNKLYSNDNTSKNYRYSVGFDGDFSIAEHQFTWDAYYYDSKIRDVDIRPGQYNLIAATQALGPSFMGSDGVVHCGTPGNVIAGCVPLNPLGTITPQMLNYIAINNVERAGYDEKAAVADISGDVLTLPAGNLTVAAGVQHRSESGFDATDPFATAGYSSDYSVQPNSGRFSLNEGYVEAYVPLLKDLPGAQSLSLDLATRWSKYSNFGSTRNSSFKLAWKPIDDLMVRASYSTNFRAPTINDLYQGLYLAGGFTDPCDAVYGPSEYGNSPVVAARCASGFGGIAGVPANFRQTDATGTPVTGPGAAGVTNSYNGGNPNLKPETGYNGDIGIVYSPSWLPGFNATVDWWSYNIRNLITGISNNQVLADCYQFGITSACSQFQRQGGNGPLAGQIINLMNLEVNAGWLKERGWDFGFNYALPEFSFGKFKLGVQGTYIATNNVQPTVGAPVQYTAGTAYGNLDGAVWRLRGNFTLAWDWHDFGANWTLRYFSPIKGYCAYPPPTTTTVFECSLPNYYAPGIGVTPLTQFPSVTFNDVQVHWNAPWKGTFSLGVNNVFNKVGPYIYGGGFNAGTDSYNDYNASYDIGRFVYIRYQQKF